MLKQFIKGAKVYFKDIRDGEELERRSSKKWREIGTIDEAVKMVEFGERKARNNMIFHAGVVLVSVVYLELASIDLKKKMKEMTVDNLGKTLEENNYSRKH